MNIVFRTDAALHIGSGHVIRCLTLAEAMRALGANCHFIGREHPGHLLELISRRGFGVTALAGSAPEFRAEAWDDAQPAHIDWLGCAWQEDARQTGAILAQLQPHWLVVDHYAIDERWEAALQAHYRQLMVIDDLADRNHRCDLLLDQNLGREPRDYHGLVPEQCVLLTGTRYALLRPEFAAMRAASLERRNRSKLRRVLVTMGGVDQHNATGQVLAALNGCRLPADCEIRVVMGMTAPWLDAVREQARSMRWPTDVLVNVANMAELMAGSDLAIGAAGSTSWERCCLGLPTLLVVLADNQKDAAIRLESAGATKSLRLDASLQATMSGFVDSLMQSPEGLRAMSMRCHEITDGNGCNLVIGELCRLTSK